MSASAKRTWARPVERFLPNPRLKFMEQCREVMRFKQLALRSEEAYLQWIRRFILFHRRPGRLAGSWMWRQPKEMGAVEVRDFLTHLAAERQVAASTQNQALNALVFLYREVVGGELGWLGDFELASRSRRVPVVLTQAEVRQLLAELSGGQRLIARVLYGTGLRLMEGLRLRVKDADFGHGQVIVRGGKGDKDRVTMLPEALRTELAEHLAVVRETWKKDVAAGFGRVWMPAGLRRKYPGAEREWGWQWVFPSAEISVDPETKVRRRHHVSDAAVQLAVKAAAVRAGRYQRGRYHEEFSI